MISTPAFWDLHLHGIAGVDFMHASSDEMFFACEELAKHGTGAFAPTLLTAEPRLLLDACARWGAFLEKAKMPRFLPKCAARPIGLHLEGPFLNPMMAGAHPKGALARPSRAKAAELVRAARGHVAIVTLAPELPGAIPLIRDLVRGGIRVQLGHSIASAKQAFAATSAGATGLTHLYNAMRIHHRAPGLLAPLLKGHATAEIITDGEHISPEFILWCWRAVGSQLYAVSDGCSAIGATAKQSLTLGSLKIRRKGSVAVVAESDVLCGGATHLTQHPAILSRRLKKHGPLPKTFLHIFYRHQKREFSSVRAAPLSNHFDPRSLRYIGTEVAL